MIYIKIYFTLLIVLLLVDVVSLLLMDNDIKRKALWWKISKISWTMLSIIGIVGVLISIWIPD